MNIYELFKAQNRESIDDALFQTLMGDPVSIDYCLLVNEKDEEK